jgi:hypothetical protein
MFAGNAPFRGTIFWIALVFADLTTAAKFGIRATSQRVLATIAM